MKNFTSRVRTVLCLRFEVLTCALNVLGKQDMLSPKSRGGVPSEMPGSLQSESTMSSVA